MALSGSGVVPDKPALVPEGCKIGADFPNHHHHASSADIVVICTRPEVWCYHLGVPLIPCPNASVPAVTDDEAATAENALAARLHQVCRFPAHKGPQVYWDCFVLAREALTAIRSAGFLLVRDHTKET